ncbi:glycerophosphodiester phosphodiesterase [Saliphagus infecundisoli]|uniref:Glycerophosphodiester phosphodiesterase n=1 Tax=Saliphagus infecundisoli TaxID=1849069 RepID=A0ABD5QHV6_9EURY|nr:glycerophosphodiester phosphodiesterase [Saliphagus infecundisoli]
MSSENQGIRNVVSRRNLVKAGGAALGVVGLSGTGTAWPDWKDDHREDEEDRDEADGWGWDRNEGVRITAHRGYRDVFPQNTVAAVAGSTRLKADRIEIDLVATSDGEIVVFHDAALDDLTDKSGLVGETPAETVLEAEVLSSGETIPTLEETLEAVRPPVMMNLEFKESGPLSWREFAERTLNIASSYPGDYYASSFDPDAIRAVREVDSSVAVAPIFGGNVDENLQIARELDAEAVNVSTGALDRDLVETAHGEGRDVNVWTIDSWREASEPLELGVDGLIADYPNMATFALTKSHHDKPGRGNRGRSGGDK